MNNKSCVFYNKSFYDDLYPHSFLKENNTYKIKYNTNNQEIIKDVVLNPSILNYIDNYKNPLANFFESTPGAWYPILVDLTTTNIKNNYLSSGFTILSKDLGFESAISFDAIFENWEVSSNARMNTDWILTSLLNPFSPQYGILCWAKDSYQNKINEDFVTIDKVAYNTILYPKNTWTYVTGEGKDSITVTISPSTKLIKKSNNTLLIYDNDKLILTNNRLSPNTAAKYFSIDKLIDYLKLGNPDDKTSSKDILFTTTSPKKVVHISTGDTYAYFDSEADKKLAYEEGLPSKTYLSPVLNDIYRQIYHNLTLDFKKDFDFDSKLPKPLLNRVQDRLFKKLCCFLATHPQIDRTTVSILQESYIREYIQEVLISLGNPEYESLAKRLAEKRIARGEDLMVIEKNIYENLLTVISSKFANILIDDNVYNDSTYIIKNLINKYGSTLRFESGKAKLKYKKSLPNGPHLKVRSDIRSLSPKGDFNSIIYNNIKITAGDYVAQTTINNNESSLRLSTNFSNESSILPLWDIKKVSLQKEKALFTTGPDLIVDFKNPINRNNDFTISNTTGNELRIDLNRAGLLFDQTQSALQGINIEFEWSRLSGPDCLRFSNNSLTTIRNNGVFAGEGGSQSLRFETSQDEKPTIYIKSPGKYTIRCRVTTLFGVISDTISIYVISDTIPTYILPPGTIPRQSREISLLSIDNNVVMVPNFKEFVFGKQGIFWPVYSDLSVLEPRFITLPNPALPGLDMRRRIGNEVKPLGSVLNKFSIPFDRSDPAYKRIAEGLDDPSFLQFDFDLNKTSIEIGHIILSNLYSKNTPYCETIYKEIFDNQLVDLELSSSKTLVEPKTEKDIEIYRPNIIGTERLQLSSPSGDLLKEKLFNNKITPLVFDDFTYAESIYARTIENISNQANPAVCFERYSETNDSDLSLVCSMQKGYFHPNSGWIDQEYINNDSRFNNKTSIIIGDGSKRYCKTFKGLGFDEITNDFIDNKIKLYKSTINLSMAEIAYDPVGGEIEAIIAADKLEENDHNVNYGYRDLSQLNTALYKYNDEFTIYPTIVPDQPVQSDEYCTNIADSLLDVTAFGNRKNQLTSGATNSIQYKYPKPGPIYAPPRPLNNQIRYDRSFGRLIGDLEIKLNFLNYINPKELVIWLEIDAPSEVSQSIISKNQRDALYYNNSISRAECINFINNIENNEIKTYIQNLFNMNDHLQNKEDINKIVDSKYYLFLSNQDHIDMVNHNNIIKFTDNVANDSSNININKFISSDSEHARIKNGVIELTPTASAPGFSDVDSYKYKNIIKNNNIIKYTLSKFSKFLNMPLFNTKQPEGEDAKPIPVNSSNISFTLNIAVLGESGDGNVYDRIINTDNIMNINNAKLKHVSNIQSNSLCSWEIVLSNDKSLLNFEDKDALGQIDYKSNEPRYPGYNFIGKIPQNLLPPINIDAPNKSIYDTSRCFYSREKLTAPGKVPIPNFNLTLLTYIPSFTIVGELANMASLAQQINNQAREFYNYFNNLRRIKLAGEFNEQIYIPKFDKYPIGRSDKCLISVSKDDVIWYKLEAGIVRYNNCSILKKKKYFYKHIHHLNDFKNLARFPLTIVKNVKDLISYKSITLKEIKASDNLKKYTLTIEEMKNFIQSISPSKQTGVLLAWVRGQANQINKDIIETEKEIKNLVDNSQEVPISLTEKLEELRTLFSKYLEMSDTIGPEDITQDDIIIFEKEIKQKKLDSDEEEIITLYEYTTVTLAPWSRSDSQPAGHSSDTLYLFVYTFTDLYTLLKYNKSLFINNNIITIQKDLQKYLLPNSSDTKIEDIKESNIVILDGIRPYNIYKENEPLDIYTEKELNEEEKVRLEALNKQLENPKNLLAKEFEKPNINRNKKLISNLKNQIINIEDNIFNLTHTKINNPIKNKGIIRNKTQFQTIFILTYPIKDNSLIIIKPSDNRVIACDIKYIGKDAGSSTVNTWSFVNENHVLSDSIPTYSKNIFNDGMYGSGSPFTTKQRLYNPEIINYIKDFIKHIDVNRFIDQNFSENYTIYNEEDIKNGKINKIFTFGDNSTKDFIKKYNSYLIVKDPNKENDIFGVLDKIMSYDKYNAYFKPNSLKFLVEGSLSDNLLDTSVDRTEGYIEFESNLNSEITYGLKNYNELSKLLDRIPKIIDEISKIQDQIEKEEEKLKKSKNKEEEESISKNIKKLIDLIYRLKLEYNLISFYIDKLNIDRETKKSANEKIIPNISLNVKINTDNSISIEEMPNDDYYIINIDAEQGCSLDLDKMPKILTNIEYECLAPNSFVPYVDAYRFCPGPANGPSSIIIGDYQVQFDNLQTRYTLLPDILERLKRKFITHPNLDWDSPITYQSERSFFLNGNGQSRGGIVKAKYTYIVPQYIRTGRKFEPEGNLQNKVRDIFNLEQTNNIKIDFKKINRNIKNIDNLYDKYIPTADGLLVKSLTPAPGGRIDNTYKIWECYGRNDGFPIALPANFAWMNLVKYISFYNTYLINIFREAQIEYDIFNINGGSENIKTRDEMGLIPYDYK